MATQNHDVTEAELAVLQSLWELESGTVREMTEQIYRKSSPSLIATVQKLLERLEEKGCITPNKAVWPHRYSPAVQREGIIARVLQSTANKLCNGEYQPLLTSLVKARRLTDEDRKSLRQLLDAQD